MRGHESNGSERLAALADELAAAEAERARLARYTYDEVLSRALDEDLACWAEPATAGKPIQASDKTQAWDTSLAPLGEILGQRVVEVAGRWSSGGSW